MEEEGDCQGKFDSLISASKRREGIFAGKRREKKRGQGVIIKRDNLRDRTGSCQLTATTLATKKSASEKMNIFSLIGLCFLMPKQTLLIILFCILISLIREGVYRKFNDGGPMKSKWMSIVLF